MVADIGLCPIVPVEFLVIFRVDSLGTLRVHSGGNFIKNDVFRHLGMTLPNARKEPIHFSSIQNGGKLNLSGASRRIWNLICWGEISGPIESEVV